MVKFEPIEPIEPSESKLDLSNKNSIILLMSIFLLRFEVLEKFHSKKTVSKLMNFELPLIIYFWFYFIFNSY